MKTDIKCGAKHTKPQIPDSGWKCPKCETTADADWGFVIEESDESADSECPLLHDADYAVCGNCDYGATAKTLARLYAKKANLVPCKHCKGKGLVKA